MRKTIAFSISCGFHLLLAVCLLLIKKPLEQPAYQTAVTLIFEEEEELIYSTEESVPFAAYDAGQFKGQLVVEQTIDLPGSRITDTGLNMAALAVLANNEGLEIPPPDLGWEVNPVTMEELFIPAAENVLQDLQGAVVPDLPSETAGSGEASITWSHRQRNPIQVISPPFPPLLSKLGMEADLELRIEVSPAGRVVNLKILRSSGFPDIDQDVKKVVSDWVFETSASGQNDEGIVPIHFRLKKSHL